ncbi:MULTISPECIES: type II toxin-antitoxin system tRNA(fMet)-specific endonuclease VapC [Okeania]|uniref:type II toxin-antitoxin system tRNA(fMet)-specific endonuclease VapC n=1 Tax=Okeania TaxID=1458928 RepID=UPI000F540BDF|nr:MULTISPECIES: type II toxin-antitoxin system VapC family toxin [Okeania]NET79552.1 type II toxin-antitoxin system VapC family toxin [Okeania sp. SIO1F9]RQH12593.1 type II toxin-antitoxin system VapC family toxin [Okeania hirsuta]
MRYLLDTNVIVRYLNRRSTLIRERLKQVAVKDVFVCSVVKAELFYGANKSNNPAQTLLRQKEFLSEFISLDFDDKSAEVYGIIRANLEKKGTPVGSNDLQIAAIAMANNLTLVTHNTREFERIDGLIYEDWEEERE